MESFLDPIPSSSDSYAYECDPYIYIPYLNEAQPNDGHASLACDCVFFYHMYFLLSDTESISNGVIQLMPVERSTEHPESNAST